MSPIVRQAVQRLGKAGIASLLALLTFVVGYLTDNFVLALVAVLALLPLGCIIGWRLLRLIQQKGLWSVRNRLLCVYGLIGVLPLFLILALISLGTWALISEMAIYLANSALDQRIASLQTAVDSLGRLSKDQQVGAAAEMLKAFRTTLPGLTFYIDGNGETRSYPEGTPRLEIPEGWRNVHGLAVVHDKFYAFAHVRDDDGQITALAPMSDEAVQDLVPHLGAISIFEDPQDGYSGGHPASAGSVRAIPTSTKGGQEHDFKFTFNDLTDGTRGVKRPHLPPAMFRFDVPVGWVATLPHYHLGTPNKKFAGVMLVYCRPSAVLGSFFSGTESLRGVLFDALLTVAFLFLLLELIAVLIGARLARRLTGAINAVYEGTQRVIRGDFGHRIPVHSQDQLGELAGSFNQMTGNLERLLVVEKEKERLQTEVEIAREVQSQLYPKAAPPTCGLKLSVQCDPARMVSGDYYDYQELSGKRLAFAIGDVAGKGISAALLMATLQAALRSQMTQYQPLRETDCDSVPEIDVAKLVSKLNKQIFAHTSPEKYATFFFGLFDERSRTLTYTNAGHLSPLLIRNGEVTPLDSNGTVVGAFPFSRYEESCLTLDPGDLLICYTDGITEPENAYGEEFGEERLIDLVKKHAHREDSEIIRIVLDTVRDWTATSELHDDMTLMLAREVQTA